MAISANRSIEAGQEILATYGAHSNDKLLVHYGFINVSAPGEPTDDDIRLDHIILPALPPATREALQDVGFLGAYALLPATNELCFRTQVAIRAVLLTANEWEVFISTGEDLSGDQTPKVLGWLGPRLSEFHTTARQKVASLTEGREGEKEAVRLLEMRWQQIVDALEAFQPSLRRIGDP